MSALRMTLTPRAFEDLHRRFDRCKRGATVRVPRTALDALLQDFSVLWAFAKDAGARFVEEPSPSNPTERTPS